MGSHLPSCIGEHTTDDLDVALQEPERRLWREKYLRSLAGDWNHPLTPSQPDQSDDSESRRCTTEAYMVVMNAMRGMTLKALNTFEAWWNDADQHDMGYDSSMDRNDHYEKSRRGSVINLSDMLIQQPSTSVRTGAQPQLLRLHDATQDTRHLDIINWDVADNVAGRPLDAAQSPRALP